MKNSDEKNFYFHLAKSNPLNGEGILIDIRVGPEDT